jgi:glycosyltransferase domain-containing protein
MKKITILLTLKDRSEESVKWLSNNIYSDFNYIIADGSSNDLNKKIFSNLNYNNLKYFKFPYDKHYKDYYKKVYLTSLKIKTPYTMQVDNDDLINKKAIRKCIYEFSLDKDLTLVNGSISGFNSFESKNYLSDFKENKCGHMNNKTSLELIESYLKNYRIIWFSIYKTEIFQDVWKHCFKFSCKNILNNEIFHGLLSCSYGKFKFLNEVTYIRRTNPINSVYRSLTIKKKIMFKGEQNRMIKYICNIFKYNKKKMLLLYNARRSMPDKRNVLSRLILFIVRKKSFTLINLVKLNNFLTFIK